MQSNFAAECVEKKKKKTKKKKKMKKKKTKKKKHSYMEIISMKKW